MLLVDARRLTGPNLLSRSPLVVVEVSLDVPDVLDHVASVYLQELGRIRVALGFAAEVTPLIRAHRGGAVIAYEAPLDVMLPCTEMSEWAALSACEILRARDPLPLAPKQAEVEAMLTRDRNPALLALEAEAKRRHVPLLWDDDVVSLGMGARSASWPRAALPEVAAVAWAALGSIPLALVTGTNGKTTTSRLLARIARESGARVGSTSSDAIMIGDDVIDEGDWTGPAAARIVLRRKDVDVAVLETARGGILRRGLAMDECDVAVITNVSEDHTGGYGIDDLAAMTRVKAVVAQALRPGGTLVLNAHDSKLVLLAESIDREVVFFADLDRGDQIAAMAIGRHRSAGKSTIIAEAGAVRVDGVELARVDEVPITFGGAARYNVENVLAAVAAARALAGAGHPIDDAAIKRGLLGFATKDNPRRGEIIESGGVRVMLDFGHNPEGVRAVLQLVDQLRAERGRLNIVAGSAGDRTDPEIGEMSRAIAAAEPDRVLVRDLAGYLRGRMPGEVPRIFKRALVSHGYPEAAVAIAPSEVEALKRIFEDAKPGDFVLVLVHLDHDEVLSFLQGRS